MNYVGVDLHKKLITVCVMDANRKIVRTAKLYPSEPQRIVEFFASLEEFQVVIEATASYFWFVELVEPKAAAVVLANPAKLRVIAESTKKTDKLDAQVLAEFLARDMIPRVAMPTPRQRQHRALALTGKLSLPGAVDAILDVLAKRWRDPKDLTRRKWRGYIESLDPAILADLITAADARHVNRPANYFSRIAADAMRGRPQGRAGIP